MPEILCVGVRYGARPVQLWNNRKSPGFRRAVPIGSMEKHLDELQRKMISSRVRELGSISGKYASSVLNGYVFELIFSFHVKKMAHLIDF
mmetsp:Transcript_15781/g.25231  ORF Transcript_15781/g.25231 Transcript_15781/m.25231 type:complete len:90 (-) Transcript_15781:1275-1544(-)